MRRAQFEEVLRAAAGVTGKHELVVIGSQCVHAATSSPPAEVLMSAECDVLLDEEDPATRQLRDALGPSSTFASEHGFYVDAVSSTFPFLPERWEQRLQPVQVSSVTAHCLEIHDLALSKLAAGRLKDYELVAALIDRSLVDLGALRERVASVTDLHMRAILSARLQIVLESLGR